MPSGRKSLKEEIAVLQRYNELSVPYFKFISEMLKSKNKDDRMWAAERLDKAFVKMVPQVVQGDTDKPIEHRVIYLPQRNVGMDTSPTPTNSPSDNPTASV